MPLQGLGAFTAQERLTVLGLDALEVSRGGGGGGANGRSAGVPGGGGNGSSNGSAAKQSKKNPPPSGGLPGAAAGGGGAYKEALTPLGAHLATLPCDARIGKFILLGAIFGAVDETLTIAATLSSRSPFVAPFDKRDAADAAKRAFASGQVGGWVGGVCFERACDATDVPRRFEHRPRRRACVQTTTLASTRTHDQAPTAAGHRSTSLGRRCGLSSARIHFHANDRYQTKNGCDLKSHDMCVSHSGSDHLVALRVHLTHIQQNTHTHDT